MSKIRINTIHILLTALMLGATAAFAQEVIDDINFGWRFAKGDQRAAIAPEFDDSGWEPINLPHDWAISGPFGALTDKGSQGKLPWKGEGWYRKRFVLPKAAAGKRVQLIFDGVMSAPTVYLNGKKVGSWIYGYNSFHIDATDAARFSGENVLTVHADTREHYSRWYPGAGIYRKVTVRLVDSVNIPVWGVFVTTPEISDEKATVKLAVEAANQSAKTRQVTIENSLIDPVGKKVGTVRKNITLLAGEMLTTSFDLLVKKPRRWDINTPQLYTAVTRLLVDGKETYRKETPFGIRTFKWTADKGFFLNGRRVQIQGVNLHHDHGPLGAAFYPRAMERQIEIMQEMGVNSIRTSHNAPAPELLELCDRMGILVFNELFDKSGATAGVRCSTAEYVNKYAEREVCNFVRRDRNHPCVYTWSIANEHGDIMRNSDGQAPQHVTKLVSYLKKYDPTRPITMGVCVPDSADKAKHIMDALDTISWNYQEKFLYSLENYPNKGTCISESASAFGTRGAYKLRLPKTKTDYTKDGECNAYVLTAAGWSDIPEKEIERTRKYPFVSGEYIWTGFDYLGEPTPYAMHRNPHPKKWEGRSSYFGVVDLVGLPKDTFYLYRSNWRPEVDTVHLAPHWNWAGHEGENIPVMLYTNGDEAELFLNGKSMGRRSKGAEKTLSNLAFEKTARASSEEIKQDTNGNVESENYASKAVDGNLDTRWCASGVALPQNWQVDLGSQQTFKCVNIVWEKTADHYTFHLQVSGDAIQWNTVAVTTKNSGRESVLSFPETSARYVRTHITGVKNQNWASICEVRILPEPKQIIADNGQLTNPYYDVLKKYRLTWFDVPYAAGELKAVAYKNGKRIGETRIETAGNPAELRLTPDRKTIKADGMDLCYVTIEMTDEKGRVCPRAMDELTFVVEGPATLVGVGNGNQMGHDSFTDATHPLFYGKAVAILRSRNGEKGTVKLKVNTKGGVSAELGLVFEEE